MVMAVAGSVSSLLCEILIVYEMLSMISIPDV